MRQIGFVISILLFISVCLKGLPLLPALFGYLTGGSSVKIDAGTAKLLIQQAVTLFVMGAVALGIFLVCLKSPKKEGEEE